MGRMNIELDKLMNLIENLPEKRGCDHVVALNVIRTEILRYAEKIKADALPKMGDMREQQYQRKIEDLEKERNNLKLDARVDSAMLDLIRKLVCNDCCY